MKNKIFALSIAVTAMLSGNSFAQSSGTAEKTTCVCYRQPLVLIPYATGTRLGWIDIPTAGEYVHLPTTLVPEMSVVINQTSASVNTWRIRNPSSLGGLPTDFPGLSNTPLTGVSPLYSTSYCPGCTAVGTYIYACGTMLISGVKTHRVLTAYKSPTALDYTTISVTTISSTFAPATGWLLTEIEDDGAGNLYALFNGSPGTYVAKINLSSGIATDIGFFPGAGYTAMDLAGGYVYLLDNAASNIVRFDPSGMTSATPIPTGITVTSSAGGFGPSNHFLNCGVASMGPLQPYFYPVSPSGTYWAGVLTPNSTNLYFIQDFTPTVTFTTAAGGVFMSDATRY